MAARQQECSICMDCFKNPKLISCHHSFCYKCLDDYVQVNLLNGRFNCPICRRSVELPVGGVSAFQSNFYIDTDAGDTFACDICGPKNVACGRCLDCEENLCKSCCHVHEKSKATKHHKISDLGTLDSETKGKIRQLIFCDQHPDDEIRLFCRGCQSFICFMCKVVKHENHVTEPVPDAAAEVKKTLETKLNECLDKLRRVEASKKKGEELDKSINDAEQEELKAVDDQGSQLCKAIVQELEKVKARIKHVYHDLRQRNAVFTKDVEEEFKACSNAKDIAQTLTNQGTDIDIIKKGPNVKQLISAAISKTEQTPNTRLENKLFSPAEMKQCDMIALLGTMEDSTEEERNKKEREEREKKEREEKEKKESEIKERKERDLKISEPDLLPIGVKITTYLTYIDDCGYFCVQKEDSCIGQIAEELDKDCKKKFAPNIQLLKKGQFCAGLYSGDNCWTRAEIIDIKDSEPKVELRFVDYGNVDRVLSKDIRWLSEKTAEAPEQCIRCSLRGIQPLQNETIWSKASGLAFAEIVRNKPIIAVAQIHCDKICEVELCLLSDPDIDISETLIMQGVVRSIFPKQRYHEEIEKKEVVEFSDSDKICKVEHCFVSDSDISVNETLIEKGVGRCLFPQPPEKDYHEEGKKEEVVDASDSDAVAGYSASSGKEPCIHYLAPSAAQFERVPSHCCHDTSHATETSQSYNTKVEVANSTSRQSSDVLRTLFNRLKSHFRKEVTPVSTA